MRCDLNIERNEAIKLILYLKQATTSFLVLLVGQKRITYGRHASLNLYVKW